jgi:hypothetical protein
MFDLFAISSLNMGTVQFSVSTSNSPAHVPATFSFAIEAGEEEDIVFIFV